MSLAVLLLVRWFWLLAWLPLLAQVSRLACAPIGFEKKVHFFFSGLGLGAPRSLSILAEGAIALSVTPSGGAQFAS